MGSACFITPGRSFERALGLVRLAEELRYETVYVPHLAAHDSLTVIAGYAQATSRIRVGTGVVPIYTRTPATMSQTGATIQSMSGGRCVLGIGVSHRPLVEGWHGQTIGQPLAEMREYVATLRTILRGETAAGGPRWETSFAMAGLGPFPDLPIYLAGLSPGMLRLAGEIADGVIVWLGTPDYIRDVVVPAVAEGRAKAGKTLEDFDIVASMPSAVVGDAGDAQATMRAELVTYFGLPFYRKLLARSGFDEDLEAFDRGAAAGDAAAMQAAISVRFLDSLCAIGDEAVVRAGLERYREAGCTTPAVVRIGSTDFETVLGAAAPQ